MYVVVIVYYRSESLINIKFKLSIFISLHSLYLNHCFVYYFFLTEKVLSECIQIINV